MTQRNPMNPRNQSHEHKGSSRKSASSAKPAAAAGASVYVKTQAAKDKETENKRKEQDKEEARKDRLRRQALGAGATELPEYKVWRRWWVVCIVIAIVCVAISWVINSVGIPEGMEGVANTVAVVSLILGYAFIIACLVIDVKKIRPIRRGQENIVDSMSKRELRELDELIEQGSKKQEEKPKGGSQWKNIFGRDNKGKEADAAAGNGKDAGTAKK